MFYGLNLGTIAGGHRMSRRTSIGHHSRMSKGCPSDRPVLYGLKFNNSVKKTVVIVKKKKGQNYLSLKNL